MKMSSVFLEAWYVMGKTVESFRIALKGEIVRWSGFGRALRKPEREAFEELMDLCRGNAMAAGNACNPIIFEPLVISILVSQQIRISDLEKKLAPLLSLLLIRKSETLFSKFASHKTHFFLHSC